MFDVVSCSRPLTFSQPRRQKQQNTSLKPLLQFYHCCAPQTLQMCEVPPPRLFTIEQNWLPFNWWLVQDLCRAFALIKRCVCIQIKYGIFRGRSLLQACMGPESNRSHLIPKINVESRDICSVGSICRRFQPCYLAAAGVRVEK